MYTISPPSLSQSKHENASDDAIVESVLGFLKNGIPCVAFFPLDESNGEESLTEY